MRRLLPLILLALVVSFASARAQSAAENQVIGAWSGAYSGDGNGKYTMSIARDAAKKLGGSVTSTSDEGESSTVTFKTVVVDGAKLSITYDAPGDGGGLVLLDATIDKASLTGTWKVVDSAKTVMQSGTFTGTKAAK